MVEHALGYRQKTRRTPLLAMKELVRQFFLRPYLYLMLVPAILYYLLICYWPMVGIIIAFKDFKASFGIFGSKWAGLYYFQQLINDPAFWTVFSNTVIISLLKLLFGFPAPIILALLLNEFRGQKLKRVVQTVIYLPRFISWMILAGLVYNFFSIDTGIVNQILRSSGLKTVQFLSDPVLFRPLLVTTDIIKGAGWGSIIYIAAISSINTEMYESAVIDGAGRWRQMMHITLPSLMPTITIMFVLAIGGLMNAGFEQVISLYNPSVYQVGDILDTFVYRKGLQDARYSYTTAVGLFKSVIGCALLVTTNLVVKKLGEEGLF